MHLLEYVLLDSTVGVDHAQGRGLGIEVVTPIISTQEAMASRAPAVKFVCEQTEAVVQIRGTGSWIRARNAPLA